MAQPVLWHAFMLLTNRFMALKSISKYHILLLYYWLVILRLLRVKLPVIKLILRNYISLFSKCSLHIYCLIVNRYLKSCQLFYKNQIAIWYFCSTICILPRGLDCVWFSQTTRNFRIFSKFPFLVRKLPQKTFFCKNLSCWQNISGSFNTFFELK